MSFLLNRYTGAYPSLKSVDKLLSQLTEEGVECFKHYSKYSFDTPASAEISVLNSELESFKGHGYTFAFAGAVNVPGEGAKILIAGIRNLPPDFEQRYPQFKVIG